MWSQDVYKRAIDFAARAHGDQRVPGSGHPYVVHLAKVAMEVIAASTADPTLDADLAICCALLHDSIEDAGVTRGEIETAFGARVADGVVALTKNDALEKELRMKDSLDRIKSGRREYAVVKLADRITNLEPPPAHWTPEKKRAYRDEAQMILDRLRGSSAMLERRIADKIAQYAQYCG